MRKKKIKTSNSGKFPGAITQENRNIPRSSHSSCLPGRAAHRQSSPPSPFQPPVNSVQLWEPPRAPSFPEHTGTGTKWVTQRRTSATDVSTHVPASPQEGVKIFSISSLDLASSLQQSLRKEASGTMKIFNQPSQLPGLVLPAQVLGLGTHTQIFISHQTQRFRRTQFAHGSVNVLVTWRQTHITLCSGSLGGWSHSQWRQEPYTGDVKDPQWGGQSLPLWKLGASW